MVKLKGSEVRKIIEWFSFEPGYILEYSNETFAELFDEEFGVDIYADKYNGNGNSKASRTKSYLSIATPSEAADLLRILWKERIRCRPTDYELEADLIPQNLANLELSGFKLNCSSAEETLFFEFVDSIEKLNETAVMDKLAITARNFNFDTILREIERAAKNVDSDPEDAITASCSLVECVCRSILVELDIGLPKELTIAPLYKSVRRPLGLSPDKENIDSLIAGDVRAILSGIGATIGGIGALRSHAGDAHGREKGFPLVDPRIARLSVNSASAISLFLIETWAKKFPDRNLPNVDLQ